MYDENVCNTFRSAWIKFLGPKIFVVYREVPLYEAATTIFNRQARGGQCIL